MTEVQSNDFTIHVEYYGEGKEVVYDEIVAHRSVDNTVNAKSFNSQMLGMMSYTQVSLLPLFKERGIQWRKNHWKDTTLLLMPIVEELTVENHDLYQDLDTIYSWYSDLGNRYDVVDDELDILIVKNHELLDKHADLEAEVEELRSQISWEMIKNGGM